MPIFLLIGVAIVYNSPPRVCPSESLFNIPCGLCGGSRSFILFHKLNWGGSITLNPLVFFSLSFFWTLSLMTLVAKFNKTINQYLNQVIKLFSNNILLVFGFFIFLYLLQYLVRIIFH